ncbi:dihydrolipoamide acetyltransferase family protein [Pseudorhodoplanes sp.]|uniref:dihydrolipoamide acetyltransferase family protein n=1 Tax=Pseudorhodoplanes sp. TaxID=1934341 RepID=UPI002BEDACCF|nr:dihydrolipoamide acetyltransferase family protein [Pseudorhodoplanes sp.]HWV44248.1 dihydrolipoamide acetyltransferase family protein [Pseudorhodoplanes sp.]
MDVLMPQLGETVAEGKIVKWFKNAGDIVAPGDNLFEIETDKTSMEVPATFGGTLSAVNVQVGEVAKVGAVVAVILGEGETAAPQTQVSKPVPASPPVVPAKAVTQSQDLDARLRGHERSTERTTAQRPIVMDPFREVRTPERNFGPAKIGGVTVTPLARRLAGENGIDLTRITGSGPRGRIVARDVEAKITRAAPARSALAAGPSASEILALYRDVPFEELPLDGMRATIAARLTQAKQTIPHFYLTADVTLDALLMVRAQANEAAPQGEAGYKLSVNDFVIKALALALKRVPAANAIYAEDRILRFQRVDIGVAVALDGGLMTPVIRAADTKSLSAISNEMRVLAERARDKKLKPEEYQGGVSAVSNLGMFGVRDFSAIINPPQSTILAVGAAQRRAVETEDGGVRFESQMTVTLSCDHRVIDGALGAQLLAAVKGYLEQPVTMLV